VTTPRVAIVTTEPTASRVPQFDLLAHRTDLDLMVFYAAETVQRREWSLALDHPHEILRGPSLPTTRLLQHDYPITPSLWRKLGRGRFDCVVVWGWSTFAAQLAIIWSRLHRVPYVLFSESHLAEPRRGFVRAMKRAYVPPVVRHAAGWLATGSLAREHLVSYGADRAQIRTFANTIDVEAVTQRIEELRPRRAELRDELGFAADDVVVLVAGRLLPVKGADVLLKAASLVPGVKLLIAGDGPLRGTLETEAARLGVAATFIGFASAARLLEAFAVADLFALTSRRETWGVVVNEAAAAGLPLLLTDTVGAAFDLLEPGANGFRVPAGDTNALAAALAALAGDGALRRRFGARSRELAAGWGYGPSGEAFAEAVRAAIARPRQ